VEEEQTALHEGTPFLAYVQLSLNSNFGQMGR
jgi:hypothetical protein